MRKYCVLVYNEGMDNLKIKKRQIWVFLGIVLVIFSGSYLNLTYSRIYRVIGEAKLSPVKNQSNYLINNRNDLATSTLFYAALGDSLTAGVGTEIYTEALPYLLAEKLAGDKQPVELSSFSVPGITTSGVVSDLLSKAIEARPDIITLLIGVNDIHNKVLAGEFAKNYEEILSRLRAETKARVYVISIPFIGSDKLMSPFYQKVFDKRTREFNVIIKGLAGKYQFEYVDLYSSTVELFKSSGSYYSKDLFHPSASGYQLWADIIYDHIN